MNTQPQKTPLPDHIAFILAQQLPAIKHTLTIRTTCGEIHITDPDTITEIKAVIEQRAASWN